MLRQLKTDRLAQLMLVIAVLVGCFACGIWGFSIAGVLGGNSRSVAEPIDKTVPLISTPTDAPVPTIEVTHHVEYRVELDVNALCTSDDFALATLERFKIPVRYIGFSSGESELEYVKPGSGLLPSEFPWSYKFTLRKSDTGSGDYLMVDGDLPVVIDSTCYALNCKIFLDGSEVKSKSSIVKDLRGKNRPYSIAHCDMWISDIDW